MIDPTSVIGSSELSQAMRSADARTGATSAIAAVKNVLSPDEQVSSTVIESGSDELSDPFLYDSEGNLQNPPADRPGQQVRLSA